MTVRRWIPIFLLSCLLATGCKGLATRFDRNRDRPEIPPYPRGSSGDNWRNSDESKPLPPPENFGPMEGETRPTSRNNSRDIISGAVVDEFSGRNVPNAYLEVTPANDPNAKPIGFRCDRDGQFQIEGLTSNRVYTLNVRAELDGRVMGGMMQVRAPVVRGVIIRVSEDRVSSLTPAAPAVSTSNPYLDRNAPPPPTKNSNSESTNSSIESSGWQKFNNNAPPPPPPTKNSSGLSNIAEGPDNGNRLPTVNIPANPTPTPKKDPIKPIITPNSNLEISTGPKNVETVTPSIRNSLLVKGLNGGDWQLQNASGKLILLDFWSPNCTPCMKALPEVRKLVSDYGAKGLEVIGVVSDMGEPNDDYLKQAKEVARTQNFNYSIFAEPKRGQIRSLFQVKALPTMILIDRQGNVLWRGTGASPSQFQQLDQMLRSKLK